MQDTSDFPVMAAQCPSYPFHVDEEGRHPDARLVSEIQHRCLTESSHICHHPRKHGQPETHLCRGARDFQLQIFHRWGLLESPTDEDWERARARLGIAHKGEQGDVKLIQLRPWHSGDRQIRDLAPLKDPSVDFANSNHYYSNGID